MTNGHRAKYVAEKIEHLEAALAAPPRAANSFFLCEYCRRAVAVEDLERYDGMDVCENCYDHLDDD
jgi:hypothetical protein